MKGKKLAVSGRMVALFTICEIMIFSFSQMIDDCCCMTLTDHLHTKQQRCDCEMRTEWDDLNKTRKNNVSINLYFLKFLIYYEVK